MRNDAWLVAIMIQTIFAAGNPNATSVVLRPLSASTITPEVRVHLISLPSKIFA